LNQSFLSEGRCAMKQFRRERQVSASIQNLFASLRMQDSSSGALETSSHSAPVEGKPCGESRMLPCLFALLPVSILAPPYDMPQSSFRCGRRRTGSAQIFSCFDSAGPASRSEQILHLWE